MFLPPWPRIGEQQKINYNLEDIANFLHLIGNPQNHIPNIIHIAGTNGKGSTLAFLKAILEANNYKVNAYTSPHLLEFNERIYLGGKNITDAEINSYAKYLEKKAENLPITFFEGTTSMAFYAFSKNKADFTLLETGCGGRLDATNVVEKKLATIITSISFDHMQLLGNTISKIAYEKACIMRANTHAIIAKQEYKTALKVLLQYSKKVNAKPFVYGKDFFSTKNKLGLVGKHQVFNASSAIACVEKLKEDGFKFSSEKIKQGLENATWPARMQKISFQGKEVWLDGCHNRDGAKKLVENLQGFQEKITIFMSIKQGKEVAEIIKPFSKLRNATIYFCPMESMDYENLEMLVKIANEYNIKAKKTTDYKKTLNLLDKKEKIVFCGSLYFMAEIISASNTK